ncbi:MAG: hypothetical protein GX444_03105 [Myxococcales bacterium]|nr:hypothetical protein [Myxococcales bacterium]
MSPVGLVNSIAASAIVDRVANVQQMQVDLHQKQAEAQALRDENLRRTTVSTTQEEEKVRERKKGEERRQKPRKRASGNESELEPAEGDEKMSAARSGGYKHINLTI